jgi:hypothetical protein
MKNLTEVKQSEQTQELQRCACCGFSPVAVEEATAWGETGYTVARGAVVCSFCKMLFPSIEVAPVDLSNLELMGAWAGFVDDIRQFHTNVLKDLMRYRVTADRLMPDVLGSWLVGSALESKAQTEYFEHVVPIEALTRVLAAIEVASVLADEYDHEADVARVRDTVEDAQVAPVWASWLCSHCAHGKAIDGTCSHWARCGAVHIESSIEWTAKVAREAARRQSKPEKK